MKDLKDRYGEWALVTGASAGIGEAFAHHLARSGMSLILVARRKERLDNLASDLVRRHPVQALPLPLDLTAPDFLERLVQGVGGREVGMLVNNAGFGSAGRFVEQDVRREADMVLLNCWAGTAIAHQFIPGMIARRRGAVIWVSSVAGYQPMPFMTTYAATKAFDLSMGEALWYELRPCGIDALALSPGTTATEFQAVARMSVGPIVATAEEVVATAMRALGRKPSVVAGRINRILAFGHRVMPRRVSLALAGRIVGRLHTRGR